MTACKEARILKHSSMIDSGVMVEEEVDRYLSLIIFVLFTIDLLDRFLSLFILFVIIRLFVAIDNIQFLLVSNIIVQIGIVYINRYLRGLSCEDLILVVTF